MIYWKSLVDLQEIKKQRQIFCVFWLKSIKICSFEENFNFYTKISMKNWF